MPPPAPVEASAPAPKPVEAPGAQQAVPAKPKGIGLQRLSDIWRATKQAAHAPVGERMATFLTALHQDEIAQGQQSDQTGQETEEQSQVTTREQMEALIPGNERTKKFRRILDRPSLIQLLAYRIGGKLAPQAELQEGLPANMNEIRVGTVEANNDFLRNSLFQDSNVMDRVERGELNLDDEVVKRIGNLATEMNGNPPNPQVLRNLLPDPSDDTMFALGRLEKALWKNKATREAGRQLRMLRKASDMTMPRYLAEGALRAGLHSQAGQKAIGQLNQLGDKVLAGGSRFLERLNNRVGSIMTSGSA